jgi:hypothetical protein
MACRVKPGNDAKWVLITATGYETLVQPELMPELMKEAADDPATDHEMAI